MTQEEFDNAPLLNQILYDTTGMLVENHPSIAEAMEKYYQAKLKLLGIAQVDVNAKWECCKCGWIGTHSESADKTPVVNDAWLLVCPKCGNKDEFYI